MWESDEATVVISYYCEDSIIRFDNKKARLNAIFFQSTSAVESPTKSKCTTATKLIRETPRLKTIMLEKMHDSFEARACYVIEDTTYDGERKKRVEQKKNRFSESSHSNHYRLHRRCMVWVKNWSCFEKVSIEKVGKINYQKSTPIFC